MAFDERDLLAEQIVEGEAGLAIASCTGDPGFAAEVSRAAANLLAERWADRMGAWESCEPVWPRAQAAFVAFAAVPGADARRLAEALLQACAYEFVPGEPDQLHDASLRLILDHCSSQVEALLAQSAEPLDLGFEDDEPSVEDVQAAMPAILEHLGPPWSSAPRLDLRFVVDAMWTLPGEEGVAWMQKLLRCASAEGHLPATCQLVSRRPLTWSPRDWTLRLEALSEEATFDYPVFGVVFSEDHPAPPQAAPALTRFACVHATHDEKLLLVRRAGTAIRRYRSGDPAIDLDLLWWGASGEAQLTVLRWIIELCGAAGDRDAIVAAARERGLIDPATATFLGAALERPLWADGDVPWLAADVIDLGPLAAVDGVLHVRAQPAVDLAIVGMAEPAVVHAVRAVHPVHGRRTGAIDVVVGDGHVPERWERHPLAVGAATIVALTAGPDSATIEAGSDSDVGRTEPDGAVWCRADADATLWIGRSGERVTRVVIDAGPLRVDPERGLAWAHEPAVPPDAQTPLQGAIGPEELGELARRGASLAQQRLALRAALRQRGISDYSTAAVMRHVRDGVALRKAEGASLSRLGGEGRLPAAAAWPTIEDGEWHLGFLAELSLADLPHVPPLPPDGTLLIYQDTECWGFDRNPLFATRVFYVPEGGEIVTARQPDKVIFPMPAMAVRGIAQPIAGESTLVVEALELLPDRQRVIDAMNELVHGQCGRHWLLGSSVEVQDPPRSELPYILGALSENDRSRFASAELQGDGWIQLAQLNWDDDAGIMVGDGGNFYLMIPERDLQQRRFDRVVGVGQSH